MADISTSQSDSSEFMARSVGVCEPRDKLPRRSQNTEDCRREHPGSTSRAKSPNSSLAFKASQTNEVGQE